MCCHCEYSYDSYEVLCRMERNVILMQKHLRELLLHHPKVGRTHRTKKKRKVEGMEEEDSIFSSCLDSHSSQEALEGNQGGFLSSE